jgi:hypothetical protein
MEDLNAGLLPVSAVASIEQLADLFTRVEVCEADAKKLQGGIQQPLERVATSGASQEKPFASLWSEAGELIGFLELGDFDTKPSWKIRFIL